MYYLDTHFDGRLVIVQALFFNEIWMIFLNTDEEAWSVLERLIL